MSAPAEKTTVEAALASLAEVGDPDAQAAFLQALVDAGIIYRGTPGNCSLCIVGLYLRRFTDAFWSLVVILPKSEGSSLIRYALRLDTGFCERPLDDSTRELALRFDRGDYPGLVDPNTQPRKAT